MRPEELDKLLFKLKPHEILYREQNINAFNVSDPKKQVIKNENKEDLLKIIYEQSRQLKHSRFLVKQHSRFQSYPVHVHDWIELVYMYHGSSKQIINGIPYTLKKGQTLLIDSDVTHYLEPLREEDIVINIIIKQETLKKKMIRLLSSDNPVTSFFVKAISDDLDHDDYILFPSENNRRIKILMQEYLCEYYDPSRHSVEILDNFFSLILLELVNIYESELCKTGNAASNGLIFQYLNYIEENYKDCNLKSMAKHFSLNPNYLSFIIKKSTGQTFIEILQKIRIANAKKLLVGTNKNISEISEEIGYNNVTFFYKKFKEIVGCLPLEYRNNPNAN